MQHSVVHIPERITSRFKAKKRALVWCHQDTESLPYHLIDISTEGLSFKYLGPELNHDTINRVSLYYGNMLIVNSLPVEFVSDILLEDSLVPVRRAGIFIKSMNALQSLGLQYFIRNFTEQEF